MAGTNKVFIKGNLGRDPELRHTQAGKAVCSLNVATNEKWTSEGERKTHTEWHRVALFGRQAEVAAQYLTKGSEVLIWGKLRTRKYQGSDEVERYSTDIHVDEIEFVGGKRADGGNAPQSAEPPPRSQARPQAQRQPQPHGQPQTTPAQGGDDFYDDDSIPF